MADKRQECFWPMTPAPTFDEVYKGAPEAEKEYSLSLEKMMHPRESGKKPEALDGIRVLDCSTGMIIGHWASSMLSELGAETIQVEPPEGDPLRKLTPFGRKDWYFKDKEKGEEIGMHFLHEMRNKQSVTLNLETEKGRSILTKLALKADVLIENAPPGQFDAWGIGYRQLSKINPRLVYCWVGQKGQWGPDKDRPGELEPTAQCASGFTHATGFPKSFGGIPTRSGLWMADHVGGTTAAMGIISALIYREQVSRKGQFVEATGAEAIIRILDYNWAWYGMDGSIRPRYGNWDLAINIYGVNPVIDGYLMVGGGHDRLWYRIWKAVGKDNPAVEELIVLDKGLRDVTERLPHYAQVKTYTALSEWGKDNTRQQAEDKLLAEEVASGGVLFIDEVAEYPHFKYRGHVDVVDDALYGKVLYGTNPIFAEKTPSRLKWIGRPIGYDNKDVYSRLLGFPKRKLNELSKEGVI